MIKNNYIFFHYYCRCRFNHNYVYKGNSKINYGGNSFKIVDGYHLYISENYPILIQMNMVKNNFYDTSFIKNRCYCAEIESLRLSYISFIQHMRKPHPKTQMFVVKEHISNATLIDKICYKVQLYMVKENPENIRYIINPCKRIVKYVNRNK